MSDLRPCQVCGENRIIKKPGYILGRACLCARDAKAQAKVDQAKPRCGALISVGDAFEEHCGDAEGHAGRHGQQLVTQVKVIEEPVAAEEEPLPEEEPKP